jgi:hypothetical protein
MVTSLDMNRHTLQDSQKILIIATEVPIVSRSDLYTQTNRGTIPVAWIWTSLFR